MNKREIIQKREPETNAPKHVVKKENEFLLPIAAVLTILSHVGLIVMILWSYRYFNLSKQTFISIIMILICLIIITDIIFLVAFRYKDAMLKIVNIVLALMLMVGTGTGSYYLNSLNKAVDEITDNSGTEQYQTIGVVFATHADNASIKTLDDLKGKTVGVLKSFSAEKITASSLGRSELEKKGIDVQYAEFNSTNDLFLALAAKEVDAAVFQQGYRTQFNNEDGYDEYVEKIVDIDSFEEKVQVNDNKSASLNLADNPFNILLIGLAPEPGGGGLPDAIILASVNPQTMTVSMVSIARDSYVSIPCYGGSKNKINDTGADRACLMESVSNLLDKDIDLYMEVNFKGLVDIIDALGSIWIESPVEFVGQNSSTERGNYTNKIYYGGQWVDGEHALTFARERKRMPNGDFDRQKHQKEVIIEIVKGLLNLRDANKALEVMKIAGENFSTNLSLKQLTDVFNLILNATNYTGNSTFGMIDIQQLRITGYPSWFYNYSMRLPLWIYRLYNGSIAETQARIEDVLGEYDLNTIETVPIFNFFAEYNYVRAPLYSETFNEQQVHEPMPAFVAKLTNMSYAEAQSWAAANGVTLNVTFITNDSPGYDASQEGWVMSQSVRYGALVSENPVISITVMGSPMTEEDMVPNFVGGKVSDAQSWANANGIPLTVNYEDTDDASKANIIIEQSVAAGSDKRNVKSLEIKAYNGPISVDSLVGGMNKDNAVATLESQGIAVKDIVYVDIAEGSGLAPNMYYSSNPNSVYPGKSSVTLTITKCPDNTKWNSSTKVCEVPGPNPTPTPTPTSTPTAAPHVHDFSKVNTQMDPTCDTDGYIIYECTGCGALSDPTPLSKLGHDFSIPIESQDPTCDEEGWVKYKCSRCGAESEPYVISKIDCTVEEPSVTPGENEGGDTGGEGN